MPALVSICLPVFNGENFLSAAIESVLAQTLEDFELLISDDCSTDASFSLAKSYAARDRRIRVVQTHQRMGLFENYNNCIRQSTGKYLKPFSQDDILREDNLELLVGLIESEPDLALAAGSRAWIDENGRDLNIEKWGPSACEFFPAKKAISRSQILKRSLHPFVNFIGEPSAVIFPRAISGAGFNSEFHHIGDLEYWFRLLESGNFICSEEPLSKLREHPERQTHKNFRNLSVLTDFLLLTEMLAPTLEELGFEKEELIADNISGFSRQLKKLNEDGELKICDLEGQDSLLLQATYRALLLLAERQKPSTSLDPFQEDYQRILSNERRISRLENYLQKLLKDPGWIGTRVLREINSRLGLTRQLEGSGSSRPFRVQTKLISEKLKTTKERQYSYIAQLEDTLDKIRSSRSWRLRQLLSGGKTKQTLPLGSPALLKRMSSLAFHDTGISKERKSVRIDTNNISLYSTLNTSSCPKVTVIVSMENHSILKALLALNEQSLKSSDYEVLVVDSLVSSRLESDLKQLLETADLAMQLHVIKTSSPGGRARAHNQGILLARSELIVFLACDFLACPDFLKNHLEFHNLNPDDKLIGIGAGYFPDKLLDSDFRSWLDDSGVLFGTCFRKALPRNFYYAANSSLKKQSILEAGLFDEDFPGDAWDDYEFGLRLTEISCRSKFVTGAECIHEHAVTLEERLGIMKNAGRAACIFDAKYSGKKPWHQDFLKSPGEHREDAENALLQYQKSTEFRHKADYFQKHSLASFIEGYIEEFQKLSGKRVGTRPC